MSPKPWTDAENDLIVADYFAMLRADLSGDPYNKADHRRRLLPSLKARSEASIEFKHQNISAVLQGIGEDWLRGYRPAANFQLSLVDAVVRWLDGNKQWTEPALQRLPERGVAEAQRLWIGTPPTLSNAPPPDVIEKLRPVVVKFDPAARDERNRALGQAGEELAYRHERTSLAEAGRHDLSRRVEWVSRDQGDGAGFDIASFEPDGRPRLIEVKTTNGWDRTPFFISRNELAVAEERGEEWCLLRLWNFSREPQAFELRPPLEAHVSLMATAFEARFH